jgi:hypothetical protein
MSYVEIIADYENELERIKYIKVHGYYLFNLNNIERMMKSKRKLN